VCFFFLIGWVSCQTWPSLIYGDWEGVPNTSPLGPFVQSQMLPWKIRPLSNGGFLMWDNMTESLITNSTQQFWALGDTLYYCGWLYNFFSSSKVTLVAVYFSLVKVSDNGIMWCDTPACSNFVWQLTVSETTLNIEVMLYVPVVHVNIAFSRVSSNATVIPFTGTIPDCRVPPNPDAVNCPYKVLMEKNVPKQKTPEHLQGYDHCYLLNDAMGVWSEDLRFGLIKYSTRFIGL